MNLASRWSAPSLGIHPQMVPFCAAPVVSFYSALDNAAVFKNIPIREPLRLQFRCEFYNAWNHTQFSGVDTAARFDVQGKQVNARMGEFTAARGARIIQLALRLSF